MIQMLPPASLAALDTWPSVQPFGMCGQDGSTTNFGTSTLPPGMGGAAEVRCHPGITSATTVARARPASTDNNLMRGAVLARRDASELRTRCIISMTILPFGFPWNHQISICQQVQKRVSDFDFKCV